MHIGKPHKLKKIPNALYWTKDRNYDSAPRLLFDYEIKQLIEDNNAKETSKALYDDVKDATAPASKIESINDITTPFEYTELMNDKPVRNVRPVDCVGRAAMIFKRKLSLDACVDIIKNLILSDCWGLYTRDVLNKPVKVYFDLRKNSNVSVDTERKYISDPNNLKKDMDACITNNHTLCCVIGRTNYSDNYMVPQIDRSFDWICVAYY